jgi:hypothetical protein
MLALLPHDCAFASALRVTRYDPIDLTRVQAFYQSSHSVTSAEEDTNARATLFVRKPTSHCILILVLQGEHDASHMYD